MRERRVSNVNISPYSRKFSPLNDQNWAKMGVVQNSQSQVEFVKNEDLSPLFLEAVRRLVNAACPACPMKCLPREISVALISLGRSIFNWVLTPLF